MPFHFNCEIDWDGVSGFTGVHENISSEVKAITIEYGRDNDLQRAQAGRARIIVRDSNANWLYGNVSSDIVAAYGGIYPARPIRVFTLSNASSDLTLRVTSGQGEDGGQLVCAGRDVACGIQPYVGVPATGDNEKRFNVEAVRVLLWRPDSGNPGLLSVGVQSVLSGVGLGGDDGPDGNNLNGIATLNVNDLPTRALSAEFRTIVFGSGAQVTGKLPRGGETHAIVLRALSAAAPAAVRWVAKSGDFAASSWANQSGNGWDSLIWTDPSIYLQGHVIHDLFTGLTDDVAAEPAKNARQATIYANDGTDQLQRAKITMALQENKYSGGNSGLVNLALDRAGWPANRRAISSAELDLYPLVHADRQAAKTFLEDIERSEFGFGYIRNDGYFAWEDRNYRTTWARCTSSQWTCTENEHRNITPISPLAGIINTAILRAQPKTKAGSLDVIWSLQENAAGSNSPFLGTGSVTNYWAKYALSGQVPNIAGEVAALISGTDFTANTARDGSGTDKTVQISTAITIFAGSAKLAVTNLSNAVYLTKLQVRGKIYRDDPPLEVVAEDTSSQTAYLERHFEADLPYYSNAATMQAVADAIVAARKNPKAVYEVELVNADDTIWEQILARRISDRITLSNSAYNISGDFFIEKIRHEISEAGKFHRCWWTVTAV